VFGLFGRRTSDLIPLCHPLPLDKVHVDIRLEGNTAIVECECRVTHKTGVEMEVRTEMFIVCMLSWMRLWSPENNCIIVPRQALTGASVAALVIYDMVKAVSHRVTIQETLLLRKTGGKLNVEPDTSM
jgi:cyclic pyranopterin phosphate synthase